MRFEITNGTGALPAPSLAAWRESFYPKPANAAGRDEFRLNTIPPDYHAPPVPPTPQQTLSPVI